MTDAASTLEAFLAGEIRRGAMPGAAWWVADEHVVLAQGGLGNAALEPNTAALTIDTPFDLASLTKALATALLATCLHRERKLDLDESLGVFFPQLSASPFAGATLRDAAAHRAGFPAWVPLYRAGVTRDDYIGAIAACERPTAPGDSLYSDLGYVLLGFAVEQAAGVPLDRLFQERVARPLALLRCGFPGTGDRFADAAATERSRQFELTLADPAVAGGRLAERVSRGQVHDGNAWGLGGVAGHAGLFGTASEVATIALAVLDPRRLGLNEHDLDAMKDPVVRGRGARTVGFVLARDIDSVRGVLSDDAVGHLGFTGTSVWIDRAKRRVYVLLTNRVHPTVPREPFTATRRAFHDFARAL